MFVIIHQCNRALSEFNAVIWGKKGYDCIVLGKRSTKGLSYEIIVNYDFWQIEEPTEVLEETTANDVTDYSDWSTFNGESLFILKVSASYLL